MRLNDTITNPVFLLLVFYGYIIYIFFFSYNNPLMKRLDKWCKGDKNEDI